MRQSQEKISFIPVARGHIPEYRRCWDQVAREVKWLLALKAPPIREVRKIVLRKIKESESFFLALAGKKVIGWCDIRPDHRPGTGHVGLLYMGVLREYRQRGIGAQLLETTLKHAEFTKGYESVQLEVFASNQRAIRLYRKFGFAKDGLRKKARKHLGKYEDILLMSKTLNPRKR